MKNKVRSTIMLGACLSIFGLSSCTEDSFVDTGRSYRAPSNLVYMDLTNARDHSYIKTARPTVDTGNLMPTFEITSVTDADGNELSVEEMAYISVINPTEVEMNFDEDRWYVDEATGDTIKSAIAYDHKMAGCIEVANGNNLEAGTYYFDVKVSTEDQSGNQYSTIFNDVFKLSVLPRLVSRMMYWPISQNIVPGDANLTATSKALALDGDQSNISFQLGDNTDKLAIDPQTGAISIADGYTVTARENLCPIVQIVNNDTQEIKSFQGSDVITVVLSPEAVTDLPSIEFLNMFYAPFTYKNATSGFTYQMVNPGVLPDSYICKPVGSTNYPGAKENRPTDIGSVKSLQCSLGVSGKVNTPFDVWIFINAQDLTPYQLFSEEATFYLMNKYLEYMPDGSQPVNLDVMVSTNYTGDVEGAMWTNINDQITFEIGTKTFEGMPYFGTLKNVPGESAETTAIKAANNGFNTDGKWMKGTFSLNDFSTSNMVTVAFRMTSNFTEPFTPGGRDGEGRPGNLYISDVNYNVVFE